MMQLGSENCREQDYGEAAHARGTFPSEGGDRSMVHRADTQKSPRNGEEKGDKR